MVTPTEIKKGTDFAASVLRIFSALWATTPVPPWRYFLLGQLVARYSAGVMLKAVTSEGNVVWTIGTSTAVLEGAALMPASNIGAQPHQMQAQASINKDKLRISSYARYLIAGKEPPGVMHLNKVDSDYNPESKNPHWLYIFWGMADWKERFQSREQAVLGMSLAQFIQPLQEAERELYDARNAFSFARARGAGTQQAQNWMNIKQNVFIQLQNSMQSKMLQLTTLWRGIPAVPIRSEASARAKLGLKQKQAEEREERKKKHKAAKAHWNGPPVDWAFRIAALNYKVFGASAVLRYIRVNRDAMLRHLRWYAPEALADTLIKEAR